MKNTALFLSMIDRYNRAAFTHKYIFGFSYKGNVYMSYAEAEALPALLTLDQASRGCGSSIRFCPNADKKLALLANAKVLCSLKFFEAEHKSSIYNRGEIFEKLVTEYFGQTWVKDNVPFTQAGDIEVDGVAYQIKYDRATFASEKTLSLLGNF